MVDYYSTLGVPKTATQEQIKKAYRKLAMEHHPDRGGDHDKFSSINAAYDVLSDPVKKQEYDNPAPSGFRSPWGDFGDIFGNRRQQQVNRPVHIRVEMSLEVVFNGKEIIGTIRQMNGKEQTIKLNIPQGVKAGDAIRYPNLGDNSIAHLPRGDVIVQIIELRHPRYERQNNNIVLDYTVSVFDALIGKRIQVPTIEGTTLEVGLPAGIQADQLLNCKGYGLPDSRTQYRGNMYIRVKFRMPHLSETDKKIIEDLKTRYV